MSISKFKVVQLGIDNPLPKHLDTKENRALIPELRRKHVSFELKKGSNALINSIRRVMLDEMEGKSLQIEQDDIETDDENILWPCLQKQIQCIRINQDIPTNCRFTLEVKNKTAVPLMITAGMLKTDTDLKIIPFNKTYRIITLRESKYIKLLNIRVVTGTGTLFTNIVACRYIPLDVVMFDRGKGVSSNACDPTHFRFEFETNGTAEPITLLCSACKYIQDRCKIYLSELEHVDKSKSEHTSNLLDINKNTDITIFKFKDDTYTICNLLSTYICRKYSDIPLCNYGVIHPLEKVTNFNLKAKDPLKIMIEAFEGTIETFKDLEQQFLEQKPE
jgi:DNA-directed RNA polymerase subunit L